ncbi:Major Facilitator Superfamily protein [Bosea sp. OK403]|uniref:MFS transporter n=1 Tax=Bosea sp. OK403 TaxID=1855286 RepID=UPI0008E11D46|nr:MFS transporter [Bosea sp. OK403]SFJ32452.1 Major Facilitator Superfamily protein [Bosea sp. OK403]
MSRSLLPSPAPSGGRELSLIIALGVTQVVGYGCLYYAFAVLAPGMTASFGWAPEWTYGGFAAGLLAGGLIAPLVGRLIDQHGTRMIMSLGSGLAGLSLLALAEARGPIGYFAAMIALELVSTMVLYDAAFTALTQAKGGGARRAISQLTLIGGFASTLFWPLTTALLNGFDWREIYRVYAVLQFVLCVPLHLFLLPGRPHRPPVMTPVTAAVTAPQDGYLEGEARRRAFMLLALAFSLQGFVVSAMSVHMLTMLQGLGLSAGLAVGIGAMVGPSQVAGRLAEMLFGTALDPVTTAWASAALMPFGLLMLMSGNTTATLSGLFAIAYGVSLGLSSIVRGTVPLQLFGPAGYGAMLGKLSAPGLAVKAAAPLAFAILIERAGLMPSTLLLVALSALAAAALFVLARKVG